MKTVTAILHNWKTTSSGITTIAGGVTLYMHDNTKLLEALTAVLAGIGLLFAHDGSNAKTPGNNNNATS